MQKDSPKFSSSVSILALALLLSLGGNVLLYKQVRDFQKDPQKQAEESVQKLVDEVSQYIVLPEDEEPTVATVTDPEKLKEQAFFAHASMGDKVLIYTNSKKAILYNPTEHKIVEVAPINIGDSQVNPEAVE